MLLRPRNLFRSSQSVDRRGCISRAQAEASKEIKVTQLSSLRVTSFIKESFVIGSGSACDLLVQGQGVSAQHASIERKRNQVFCKALVGEDMFDDSACFLNGTEMRPKVAYLVGSGSVLRLGGPPGVEIRVEFEQGNGSNPMMEMMMKGMMAQSGSLEVKKALGDMK